MPHPRARLGRTVLAAFLGIVLVAGGVLSYASKHYGISVGLDGVTRITPLGTPPRVPTGLGTFELMMRQPDDPTRPVTYDPCRPIEYQVNDALAPDGGEQVVSRAVEVVSRATGLVFEYAGPTDRTEPPGIWGGQRGPVVIAWTTPEAAPALTGPTAGLGGSTARTHRFSGDLEYVTGGVLLDSPAIAEVLGRPGGSRLARALVVHELGHVVGLAHVDDPDELMAEENSGLLTLGPGDREGLALLGSGRCFY